MRGLAWRILKTRSTQKYEDFASTSFIQIQHTRASSSKINHICTPPGISSPRMDSEGELWMTCGELVETPFRYFASPQASRTQLYPFQFPRLFDLPLEIIHMILEYCDASTLFQLMRTCKFFRATTLKSFWSDTEIWYMIPKDWWNSRKFHHPVSCCLNLEFSRNITQIQVDTGNPDCEFAEPLEYTNYWPEIPPEGRSTFFWRAIQQSFPSARRLIL